MKKLIIIIFIFYSFNSFSQEVRDNAGHLEGRWSDTDYRDSSGSLMGRANGISKEKAAVNFFFISML
jgi:hypothetical protein